MNRVNGIYKHSIFIKEYSRIESYEQDRTYCGHLMDHYLNVARIGYILILENKLEIDKEVIYAFAVLHDIGRADEYAGGEPHHIAGLKYAKKILEDVDFSDAEQDLILQAIENHGNRQIKEELSFRGLMYKADKLSRPCFSCVVESSCRWSKEKKNWRIEI